MGLEWTGKWVGGRTYVANGKTVFVIEKMRHGRRYTTPLDAVGEREALPELALFERDPEAYVEEVGRDRLVVVAHRGALETLPDTRLEPLLLHVPDDALAAHVDAVGLGQLVRRKTR